MLLNVEMNPFFLHNLPPPLRQKKGNPLTWIKAFDAGIIQRLSNSLLQTVLTPSVTCIQLHIAISQFLIKTLENITITMQIINSPHKNKAIKKEARKVT